MTSKEALKYLECIYEHEESVQIPYDDPIGKKIDYKKEFDILRKLVERDAPMKVIRDTVINGVCLTYKCPNCEHEIDTNKYSRDQYYLIKGCVSCLQRLDWS